MVEIFAALFFTADDPSGFWGGEPAYPDKIGLDAPELPADLRGTVVANKYAQVRS